MSLTPSNMLDLNTPAPDFDLPDTTGNQIGLSGFSDYSLLMVAFICNHCPFVKHIRHELAAMGKEYQAKGVAFVAINANDTDAFPEDSLENMQQEVADVAYTFPYLLDGTQQVAKAYAAACTPDFYLFDEDRKLIYRGQMDSSRPNNDSPVDGGDLRAAMDAALSKQSISTDQIPSIGCNIKWKPGNEPD